MKNKEVSIILPSLRRRAVLKRIREFAVTNRSVDYEIIVVSPFLAEGDRVVHVYESEPLGCIHAHDSAYRNSQGGYIVPWADDTSPTKDCLANMVEFVRGKGLFIGSFRVKDRRGRELVQWAVYDRLYATFGCVSRKTIALIGGYYDPIYKSYWADPDLSLRLWERGGMVGVCPDAWIITEGVTDKITAENSKRYFLQDTTTFFNRWHDKLGKGIEKSSDAINKPIGNGYIRPAFSIPVTILNKILVLYSILIPMKIQKVVRSILNKIEVTRVSRNV